VVGALSSLPLLERTVIQRHIPARLLLFSLRMLLQAAARSDLQP
jgi:hypothetical protein